MNNKTQTIKNFTITQDGEVLTPSAAEIARQTLIEGLGRAFGEVKLQSRLIAFDTLHGTHYRQIRKDLVAEQKRRQFEASIGLTRR